MTDVTSFHNAAAVPNRATGHGTTGHGTTGHGTVSQAPSTHPHAATPGRLGSASCFIPNRWELPFHESAHFNTHLPPTPSIASFAFAQQQACHGRPGHGSGNGAACLRPTGTCATGPSAKTTRARSGDFGARRRETTRAQRSKGWRMRASVGNRRPCPSFFYLYTDPCYRRPLIFLHHANTTPFAAETSLVLLRRL